MEFNVTISLTGLNMSAIGEGGDNNDNESDGMAVMTATMNLTHLAMDWLEFRGEPKPDPMHPGVVLLHITVRVPRFGDESQASMMQRFNSYSAAFHNLPEYNRELDAYAMMFNAPLVSQVDISDVFVSGVAFFGNFMQNPVPSMSPVVLPGGGGDNFVGLEFNATLIVSGLDFEAIMEEVDVDREHEKMAIVMATQNLTGIMMEWMSPDVSVFDASNPDEIPIMKIIINVKVPR
jgi:hypothetical protein